MVLMLVDLLSGLRYLSVIVKHLEKGAGTLFPTRCFPLLIARNGFCWLPFSFYHLFISLLSWNVCEIGNSSTLSHLKFLLWRFSVKLLILLEPKISGARAKEV